MRYRKKPVVIDADVWPDDSNPDERERIMRWVGRCNITTGGKLAIQTLEGEMTADVGDWIIRGVKGEFYPCKPDIFAATYEPVDALVL